MINQLPLHGKSGIVTGASSGIGKATAIHLAEMGANLALADLDQEGLEAVAEKIISIGRAEPLIRNTDISIENEVSALVQAIIDRFGAIDFLVNSAGILRRTPFLKIETREWDQVISINLRGQYFLCRDVIPHMKTRGQGVIVNVASLAGRTCSVLGGAHYTTAKHALVGFTRHLAREFAKDGIRINAFCPGATRTPMFEMDTSSEETERIINSIPRGAIADASEHAWVIGFLISEASKNIIGACIDSNGGALMI